MVKKTRELSQKWGYWLSLGEGRECIRAYMVPATFSFKLGWAYFQFLINSVHTLLSSSDIFHKFLKVKEWMW